MKNCLITISVLLLLVSSKLLCQSAWTYYKYKDLPVPTMSFCIQSDYNGGVFLGGTAGLFKHNGIEWIKIYYNELDPMSQDNKYNIRRVIVLGGEVWASTNEGLIKFNGYERTHYNLANRPAMSDDKIRGIARDKYGNIWFVNHALGIFKLDRTTDSVVYYSIPQTTPLPFSEDIPMFCDAYDNLWYSCAGKFVKFSNSQISIIDSSKIPFLKNDTVSSIQIMSDNSIMVLTKHSLIRYRDIDGNITFNKMTLPDNLLDSNEYFYMIKVDLEGNCWILSRLYGGESIHSRYFYKYSGNNVWTKYEFPLFEGTDINNYALSNFTIDEKGKVWFSDPYYGVFVFDSKATSVENDTYDDIMLSPNPANDYIYLNKGLQLLVPGEQIKFYNSLGECVITIETGLRPVSTKIDVSGLAPGVYFVKTGEKITKFTKL